MERSVSRHAGRRAGQLHLRFGLWRGGTAPVVVSVTLPPVLAGVGDESRGCPHGAAPSVVLGLVLRSGSERSLGPSSARALPCAAARLATTLD